MGREAAPPGHGVGRPVVVVLRRPQSDSSGTKPTSEAPTSEAPTSEAPTSEAPTTKAPTTKAPTAKPKIKKDARYDLPEEIIDAAERGGYECGQRIDRTSLDYFMMECESGDFFTAYLSRADRDEWLDGQAPNSPNEKTVKALVGPNWTIQCADDCKELKRILGGHLVALASI